MAKPKQSKVRSWGFRILVTLGILGGLSGFYTDYRFYIQNTGVTRIDNGKKLSRAQLIDLLIVQAVQKGQTK